MEVFSGSAARLQAVDLVDASIKHYQPQTAPLSAQPHATEGYMYVGGFGTTRMFGYSLSQLRVGLSNPNLALRELNRMYHRRLNRRMYNTAGVDVVAEDWDTLVVLDACRYDMFRRLHDLPGRLESRVSRGSCTTEWLRGNFQNRRLADTVYVTGHAQLYRNQDWLNTAFHDVINIWADGGWDDEQGTVRPETMRDRTLEALETYPNKRLLVHFLQPHVPFVEAPATLDASGVGDPAGEELSVWRKLTEDRLDVTRERIWELYDANLELALPVVEELLDTLDGRTVVTSDHGNMVGERARPFPIREWGHPRGLYTEQLIRVPWLVFTSGERRTIRDGESRRGDDYDDELVRSRLENLGYV